MKRFLERHKIELTACALAALGGPLLASAATLETVDPDLSLNFDQTLRYTYAQRVSQPDARIARNGAYDQGDALFGPNEAISNRVDWLGEFGLSYQQRLGLRVSAAAWFDAAYGSQGRSNPLATPSAPSYVGNVFTPYVQRYYHGPSGEFLDAFVFGSFELGESVWNVKLGRHAVVWGESLFGSTHAVAYGQTPSDGLKSVANPGASAKETALPIGQVSWTAQLDTEWSLLGQYLYEWRPNRVPEGGTYFGASDSVSQGPNVNRLAAFEGQGGDAGLGLRWRPDWLDGTLGAYWRRFDDKAGWLSQSAGGGNTRAVYTRGIEVWGLSLGKNVGGVALGSELSYRRHGPLVSDTASSAAGSQEGARGNTWHALLNGTLSLGPSPLYQLGNLSGELVWSRLDRITSHPELFRAQGVLATCNSLTRVKGCADRNYWGAAVSFTPSWLQVWPGVDLDLPLFYSVGLRGNAPSNGGGTQGSVTWRIGLSAKVYARHQFDLIYTGYRQKLQSDPSSPNGSRVLGAPYQDKGWLSFTYQTSF